MSGHGAGSPGRASPPAPLPGAPGGRSSPTCSVRRLPLRRCGCGPGAERCSEPPPGPARPPALPVRPPLRPGLRAALGAAAPAALLAPSHSFLLPASEASAAASSSPPETKPPRSPRAGGQRCSGALCPARCACREPVSSREPPAWPAESVQQAHTHTNTLEPLC